MQPPTPAIRRMRPSVSERNVRDPRPPRYTCLKQSFLQAYRFPLSSRCLILSFRHQSETRGAPRDQEYRVGSSTASGARPRDFRRHCDSEGVIMRFCGWRTRCMFDLYNIIDEADLAQSVAKRFSNGKEAATCRVPPTPRIG